MKKIAVVYYSRTGNTEAMARIIAEGAEEAGDVKVDVSKLEDFTAEKALGYNGLVLGSPTYYGSMSGEMKKFLDDTVSYHGRLDGKVGAAFASAANIGGGNETTITGILDAMLIHGMIVQGNPSGDHYGPVSIGRPDARVKKQCRELGKRVAALVKRVA